MHMKAVLQKRRKIRKQRMEGIVKAALDPHNFYRQNGGKNKEQLREEAGQAGRAKKPTPCPAGLAASERRFRDIRRKAKTTA